MPCRDDREPDPKDTPQGIRSLLIPLLCEACDALESAGLLKKMSHEFQAWAKDHEEQEMERIKNETLARLSPKQRRALGFK